MTAHLPVPVRPNDELHPLVYRAMIGLTIWFVLSVWALFDRGSYVGLDLAIVTLFFLIFAALPTTLWLAWRRNTDPNEQHSYVTPFREWISHPFVTWTGGISGREAAMQILLPIAAVAFGMTIFGLVFLFAVPRFV
jgi:hypothetical protein